MSPGNSTRSAADVALHARMLGLLRENKPREGLVSNVRAAIREDDYENDLKLTTALDRLLDDLELA